MSDTENFKRPVVILAPHAGGDSIAYAWLLKRLKADGEAYFLKSPDMAEGWKKLILRVTKK